ncbi:methyltransferase domain-containing protein [Cellulosimicrobium sp. SH8]|uniref:methyltransferase domain-containing protein n=1 Tax=Cellulosimicrobium sp. SH8 TaxID=2952936 RepID=UPI0021F2F159|nr:methyltransferase domain-containing protein [Cellulosimicrobium sp. SH8]
MTDDVGSARRAAADRPWHAVPEHVRRTVRSATSVEQVIDAMTDAAAPWPVDVQRRLLHPASGGPAVLVPRAGGRGLVLGGERHALAPALHFLGLDVARADWVGDRLRFQQLAHPVTGAVAVHLGLPARLPFPDATFDLVWVDLDEVLALLGVRASAGFLGEVERVLAPGGTVVADVRHRGRRAVDAARRRTAPSAGLAADVVPVRLLLARAGLVTAGRHALLPHRDDWSRLVPAARLRDELAATDLRTGGRRAVARTLRALGGSGVLAPDAVVLARRRRDAARGATPGTTTLAERAARSRRPVVGALSDARVSVRGDRFVKVPLSADQQEALGREVAATHEAATTGFGPLVLDEVATSSHDGVRVAEAPLLRARTVSLDEAEDVLVRALRGVTVPDEHRPLRTTAAWRRLASARGERDCAEIGAADLRDRVLRTHGDLLVPVGPTHGDLHPDNVLVTSEGSAHLVDWNRFEPDNPLVLDAAYAACQVHLARTGSGLAEAVRRLAGDELAGPLAAVAAARSGELTPAQVAVLVVLDRVVSYSLPRRRFKPWTLPGVRAAVVAVGALPG